MPRSTIRPPPAYTARGRPRPTVITRFLDCELDHGARLLRRGGAAVHLTPKAMEVLLLLVARRPGVVTKQDLLEHVWPGTFVTDASLARTVHEVRDAIGAPGPAAIRTVHGHGYAFHAPASAMDPDGHAVTAPGPPPPPRGWLVVGGRALPLRDGPLVIGRDPASGVAIDSLLASWHHARLIVASEGVTIEDLGSKNGTTVRGERLSTSRRLEDDDDLVVGGVRLLFRSGHRVLPTKTDVDD